MRRINRNSDYQKNDRKRILRALQMEQMETLRREQHEKEKRRSRIAEIKASSEYINFEEI